MRRFLKAALAFIAGVVLGWIASVLFYLLGSSLGWWNDREGAVAMGFAFTIGPAVGVILGLVLAILVARRR